ncbi:MAG: c-type cytochrome [Thiohalocapsa sp.]|nr:c-type cytochrome [Thiohalocapsa sp.]
MTRCRQIPAIVLLTLLGPAILTAYAAPNGEVLPSNAPALARLQPGEDLPGGEATQRRTHGANAYSLASANLDFVSEMDFKVGNGLFKRLWVSAPASTKSADGLGPIYNARSCQRCHLKDGRGHPPEGPDDNAVSMFLRLSIPPRDAVERGRIASGELKFVPEPTYGAQLQDFAIQGHAAEGRMVIAYENVTVSLNGGETVELRAPSYSVADLGYGPLHPQTMLSPRVAPQMIGLGLLEAIAEADILAWADPDDANGDGISGRASHVWSPLAGKAMLGRFGWKAGEASVDEQSQGAFAGDIGISTPLHPHGGGECTEAQTACRESLHGNEPDSGAPEADQTVVDLVNFYARNLAVPARRDPGDPEVLAGKALFHETGCAACHRPSFRTAPDAPQAELADQLIWPYTDMLLHDMGEGLADNRPEGMASGREWRTAPLWGIGLTPVVNGHDNLLHDGRARGVLEAILWHGGEAQAARDRVVALTPEQRARLIRFVESL